MLKVERVETLGWEAAIRGMRNPKNSWDKTDSTFGYGKDSCPLEGVELGANDLKLAKILADAGQVHGKFLRMIVVTMDITAPLYWWKEYDTYKVGTVANSCSTMHKIHAKEFVLDDFSHEHLFNGIDRVEGNGDIEYYENPTICLEYVVRVLNYYRNSFIMASEKLNRTDLTYAERKHIVEQKKHFWWQMIQLLPSSYNQKRTIMLNYAVCKNIYEYRHDHKLDEWHVLCDAIAKLPYAKELIIGGTTK